MKWWDQLSSQGGEESVLPNALSSSIWWHSLGAQNCQQSTSGNRSLLFLLLHFGQGLGHLGEGLCSVPTLHCFPSGPRFRHQYDSMSLSEQFRTISSFSVWFYCHSVHGHRDTWPAHHSESDLEKERAHKYMWDNKAQICHVIHYLSSSCPNISLLMQSHTKLHHHLLIVGNLYVYSIHQLT